MLKRDRRRKENVIIVILKTATKRSEAEKKKEKGGVLIMITVIDNEGMDNVGTMTIETNFLEIVLTGMIIIIEVEETIGTIIIVKDHCHHMLDVDSTFSYDNL